MRHEFIKAYICLYGGTIKQAESAFISAIQRNDENYINEIISWYKNQCKLSFYND